MEKIIRKGNDLEEVLNEFYSETELTKDDIFYTSEVIKGKLFKADTVEVTIIKKEDLYGFAKEYLEELISNMGLEVNFEIKNKEDRKVLKMYSNNNQILIGKDGRTLKALENLVRQKISTEFGVYFKITLDVEDYRDKKDNRLIRLAKQTAKDVVKTKTKAVLDNMTSYERRVIHNALTDFKGVTTHSEGEEPNRHIIIEPEN
jgi:spoIIIJ-associated protein